MLSQATINRLVLARYYHRLAQENYSVGRSVSNFVSANLLQDSLEMFLLAAAEFLNAEIGKRSTFETYLDKINEKLAPKELPYRQRLLDINKTRVLSKHDGKKPNSEDLESNIDIARSFLEDATKQIFSVDFWTISLIDLIEESEIKEFLKAAQNFLEQKRYRDCLVECRKAFFVDVEKDYDFKHPEGFGIFGFGKAPAYARSQEHSDLSVNDPFDFISLDFSRLDGDLLAQGCDPTIFWNVWRLTPQVYRTEKGATWLVKEELKKVTEAEQNAAYVLEVSIEYFIKKSNRSRSIRWIKASEVTFKIKSQSANLYRKADVKSEVLGTLLPELLEVAVEYGTLGFDFQTFFWRVSYRHNDKYFGGYVSHSDVEFHFD